MSTTIVNKLNAEKSVDENQSSKIVLRETTTLNIMNKEIQQTCQLTSKVRMILFVGRKNSNYKILSKNNSCAL